MVPAVVVIDVEWEGGVSAVSAPGPDKAVIMILVFSLVHLEVEDTLEELLRQLS